LTLEVASKQRRDFGDHLELTSTMMSGVMAASMPDSDSLQQSSKDACHTLCQTGGQVKQTHFFCFQDRQRPPPKHPSIVKSRDKILGHQSSVAETLEQRETRHPTQKATSKSVKTLTTNCWRCVPNNLLPKLQKMRSLILTAGSVAMQ
jgi:hypothetical protein